ncbi:MAG: DUF4375 domain-containing protein [Planctomycetes bacterium]|nr:DUF4375 domain-containing protein [Planctomycetota bacterium]
MTDEKTTCLSCGREIRLLTAERRRGMCNPCHREAQKPSEELFANQVFERIDATIEPFTDYKTALRDLEALPRGYSLCFAFHHVHSDILNGGISQLYSNSTWSLILHAERTAHEAGFSNVSTLLREIVYYYHLKGRSKLKRDVTEDYFTSLPSNWGKTLKQLDDEYCDIEQDANSVIVTLCRDHQSLFTDT